MSHMANDDSMSDDVFEDDTLRAPTQRNAPSPTGYRDYRPPADLSPRIQCDDDVPIHKTILLGDSGVGKTSLLVQYETGKFQAGNFSATVGIGFTMEKRVVVGRVRPTWARNLPQAREEVDNNEQEGVMPHSEPPSPTEPWEQNAKKEDKFDVFGKVMLLGDSGVGKTCMLVRFRDGTFLAGNYISTVGIDFRNKIVTVDDMKVKLQIWDTAGQERFRSVTHAYYRDAHECHHERWRQDVASTRLLHVRNPNTKPDHTHMSHVELDLVTATECHKLSLWGTLVRSLKLFRERIALLLLYDVTNKTSFDNIRAWLGEIREYAQDDVVIMLLGNKSDSGLERAVRREEGERLAREYKVAFMETSAKTGLNVEDAFAYVAWSLMAKAHPVDPSRLTVRAQPSQQQRYSCPPCST